MIQRHAEQKRAISKALHSILCPRQARVLSELYSRSNWVSRNEVDAIAGAANGPDLISHLRDLLGRFPETIEMQKVDAIDRDGLRVKAGRYRLTEHGRQAVQHLAQQEQAEAA